MNEALLASRGARRPSLQSALDRAQAELENVKAAIRQGIITPTTKGMLEEAERLNLQGELHSAHRQDVFGSATPENLHQVGAVQLHDLVALTGTDYSAHAALILKLEIRAMSVTPVATLPQGRRATNRPRGIGDL